MEDKQAFLAKMKEERQKRKMALQRRARQEHIERQRRGAAAYEANELAKAARKLTPKDELEYVAHARWHPHSSVDSVRRPSWRPTRQTVS